MRTHLIDIFHPFRYDYNLQERQHNTDFFPSIAIPLFTGCYDEVMEQ